MPPVPPALELRIYPDPVLRVRAKPVPAVDADVRAVAQAMLSVMNEEEGIGLAAPQVGLSWRLFVLHIPEGKSASGEELSASADPPTATREPIVFINPVLTLPAGEVVAGEEGCLSLPGVRGDVVRPPTVSVKALDIDGRAFTLRAGGLLARCIQHEFDHLDGVLIIDRMTQASRIKTKAAVRRLEKD